MRNMDKIKKRIQLFIACTILFIIILSCLKLTFDGYYGFYYVNERVERVKIAKFCDDAYNSEIISFLRSYTGLETGYGFFGPNVASDFVFVFKIFDSNGNLVETKENLNFNSKEGKIRFVTLNGMFLEKLTDENNKKFNQYLDIIVKQVSRHCLKDYPSKYTIETSLYLYDYPCIEKFDSGEKQKVFLIKKYNIRKKYFQK